MVYYLERLVIEPFVTFCFPNCSEFIYSITLLHFLIFLLLLGFILLYFIKRPFMFFIVFIGIILIQCYLWDMVVGIETLQIKFYFSFECYDGLFKGYYPKISYNWTVSDKLRYIHSILDYCSANPGIFNDHYILKEKINMNEYLPSADVQRLSQLPIEEIKTNIVYCYRDAHYYGFILPTKLALIALGIVVFFVSVWPNI